MIPVPYCAPPEIAAIVEYVSQDGRGWPAELAPDCDAPAIVLSLIPGPIDCYGVQAMGCTRLLEPAPPLLIELDTRWPLNLRLGDTLLGAWLINHELGHALYRLPHTDHGVMGFRTIWPDAEELEAARGLES